jgi:hypothetical protein
MYIHNFLRRFLESDEEDVAKCLLEAFEATPEHPTATADKDSYKVKSPIRNLKMVKCVSRIWIS